MMLLEAADLDLHISVLDPDENAPAAMLARSFTRGDFRDEETVYRFGKNKDVMTIEIENVNTRALTRLRDEGVEVYPQPEVISLIQDKGRQKQFYIDHHIPTADFILVEN